MRYTLDPDALERYRKIGADAAVNLAVPCRLRGLFSSVLLAVADDRIPVAGRHPVPALAETERCQGQGVTPGMTSVLKNTRTGGQKMMNPALDLTAGHDTRFAPRVGLTPSLNRR